MLISAPKLLAITRILLLVLSTRRPRTRPVWNGYLRVNPYRTRAMKKSLQAVYGRVLYPYDGLYTQMVRSLIFFGLVVNFEVLFLFLFKIHSIYPSPCTACWASFYTYTEV